MTGWKYLNSRWKMKETHCRRQSADNLLKGEFESWQVKMIGEFQATLPMQVAKASS